MPDYHVGCGISAIYAGVLLKHGLWKTKSPVTDEAIGASAQWLLDNKQDFRFTKGGKRYRMQVVEEKDSSDE